NSPICCLLFIPKRSTRSSKAIEILEEAANLGDITTQSYLGSGETDILFSQTQKPDGTFDFDDSRMLYWRNKAANNGDSYSQYLLAVAAEETAPTKAIEWYEKSAKKGFVQAMTKLANIYYNGVITQKSLEKAIYWNEQAVLAGDTYQAPLQLYQLYSDSKKDNLLSMAWLGKFCSNPDLGKNKGCNILDEEIKPSTTAKQAFDIAMLYFEDDLLQNYLLSGQWFSTSCKKGNSLACEYSESADFRYRYGFVQGLSPIEYWEKGKELERTRKIGDPFLAEQYYFEAARKGFSQAQVHLGMYYIERGNQSNYIKAKRWLEKSLNSNDTSIQREAYLGLGILYYDGLGIRRN
ncbi:tetratricopeptide repeat protein, partial [Providencia stuartii]|uniref:tetratricopeptide repeat protein n=1 Tax=Providencia stuartii TaxID=588 RepID=UPI003D8000E2